MKRFITLLFALFITSISVSAQEYEIMLTIKGNVLYSDANGDWLTREGWNEKYGRKDFRKHFPHPYYYDHVVERGYIRTYFLETFKTVVGGDMEWSRVLESNLSIEDLKREAISNMDNVTYEDDISISGVIVDREFILDHNDRYYGMGADVWSANVTYEFRDGRYKVTLSNIKCTSKRIVTDTYSSNSYGNSYGYAVSVQRKRDTWSLADLMYMEGIAYNGRIYDERVYYAVANFFDRNFTAAVILSSIYEENNTDNDW